MSTHTNDSVKSALHNELRLKDVRLMRDELRRVIESRIIDFEVRTGLTVERVELIHSMGGRVAAQTKYTSAVEIEIEMT